uniref:PDZ domain-containing protein n=1 Tax=Arion vulgaris TaxID=1028688 RepID=A0A0B7BF19_9EUPU
MLGSRLNVQLHRDSFNTPWGFRLQGGRDVNEPHTVRRVFSNSPAEGQLQRGDVILSINSRDSSYLSYKEFQDILKSGGEVIQLVINRAIPLIAPQPVQLQYKWLSLIFILHTTDPPNSYNTNHHINHSMCMHLLDRNTNTDSNVNALPIANPQQLQPQQLLFPLGRLSSSLRRKSQSCPNLVEEDSTLELFMQLYLGEHLRLIMEADHKY